MTDKPNANLSDLTLDGTNLNKHTKRGHDLTRTSIAKFGSRLAGVIDKHGTIIDANDRTEIYNDTGMTKIQIIKGDPNVPIFIQYDDLDLKDSDNPARELQLGLHRSAIESFDIDAEMLALHLLEDEEMANDWYFPDELEEVIANIDVPDFQPVSMDEQPRLDEKNPVHCPHCGRNIHDDKEG